MLSVSRTATALSAMALALCYSVSVMAVPAPKSESEMLADADLVVDATSVAIVCEGPPVSDDDKTTTTYRSTLEPSQSYKGGLPDSFEIIGKAEAWLGVPPVGGWFQGPVAKGWAGKLYLARQTDGTYTKVWWNAMVEASATSSPEALPACTGRLDAGVADAQPVDLDQGPGDSAPVADSAVGVDGGITVGVDGGITVGVDGGVVADSGTGSDPSDDGCRIGGDADQRVPSFALALVLLGLCAFRRR